MSDMGFIANHRLLQKSCIEMPMRHLMNAILMLLLLCAFAAAKTPDVIGSNGQPCPGHTAGLLYRPVVRTMWSQDEGKHSYETANGFIRLRHASGYCVADCRW